MTGDRKVLAAVVLWLTFAFLVWNVIFDRILVLAGRRYSHDAVVQFRSTGTYLRIDEVMRPAAAYGVRVATLTAIVIAVGAVLAIRKAAALDSRKSQVTRRRS